MADDGENTVVDFRSAAPSARIKENPPGDKRTYCQHRQIEVWANEPIITCAICDATVDPYAWIRGRCRDWENLRAAVDHDLAAAKVELAELKAAIRLLRREYADEAEKRRAESELMILPPRRRV